MRNFPRRFWAAHLAAAGVFTKKHIVAVAVVLMLLFDVGPTIAVGVLAVKLRDYAASQSQVSCQQGLFKDQATALTARAYFAEQQARVKKQLEKKQLVYLDSFTLGTTVAEARRAKAAYESALRFSIAATHDQLLSLGSHKIPSPDDVAKCD